MNGMGTALVSIATAIIGLAIIAVVLSKKANTVEVIKAAGSAYSSAIREAVSPIVG